MYAVVLIRLIFSFYFADATPRNSREMIEVDTLYVPVFPRSRHPPSIATRKSGSKVRHNISQLVLNLVGRPWEKQKGQPRNEQSDSTGTGVLLLSAAIVACSSCGSDRCRRGRLPRPCFRLGLCRYRWRRSSISRGNEAALIQARCSPTGLVARAGPSSQNR